MDVNGDATRPPATSRMAGSRGTATEGAPTPVSWPAGTPLASLPTAQRPEPLLVLDQRDLAPVKAPPELDNLRRVHLLGPADRATEAPGEHPRHHQADEEDRDQGQDRNPLQQ